MNTSGSKNVYMASKNFLWIVSWFWDRKSLFLLLCSIPIDHKINDLIRLNDGDFRSGRVSPVQVRSFGDPVDMLYAELITELFDAVVNVQNFGYSFIPQGHKYLPTFQYFSSAGCAESPLFCKALQSITVLSQVGVKPLNHSTWTILPNTKRI